MTQNKSPSILPPLRYLASVVVVIFGILLTIALSSLPDDRKITVFAFTIGAVVGLFAGWLYAYLSIDKNAQSTTRRNQVIALIFCLATVVGVYVLAIWLLIPNIYPTNVQATIEAAGTQIAQPYQGTGTAQAQQSAYLAATQIAMQPIFATGTSIARVLSQAGALGQTPTPPSP